MTGHEEQLGALAKLITTAVHVTEAFQKEVAKAEPYQVEDICRTYLAVIDLLKKAQSRVAEVKEKRKIKIVYL